MLARLRRLLGVLACVLLLVAAGGGPAHASDGAVVYTWNDPRLTAPSGMATDSDHQVYWTTNGGASPSSACYAVRPDGRTAARIVVNAPTAAVEAIGYQGGRVFLGDIGDPTLARKKVTVISFAVTTVTDATLAYRAYDLTYADGAHDAEAMLIDAEGRISVVTRGPAPGVYQAPATLVTTKANVLTRVADAPADVTDATYLPSGRVVMRTPTEMHEVDPATWQTVAKVATPVQQRGKSVTAALTGTGLLISGQGTGTTVLRVAFPSAPETPAPSATPPPEPPSAQATAQPVNERSDSSGTIVALAAAGLVAAIAAAYTLIRR